MVTSQVRYRNPGHWLFRKDTAGTGILSWLGCHYLDLLCHFLDDRVVEVAALVAQQKSGADRGRGHGLPGAAVLQRGAGHAARGLSPDRERGGVLRRGLRHLHRFPRDGRLPAPAARNGTASRCIAWRPAWEGKGKQDRVFEPAQSPAYGGVSGEEFLARVLARRRAGGQPGPAPIDAAVHVLEIIEACYRVVRYGSDGADRIAVGGRVGPNPRPLPSREGELWQRQAAITLALSHGERGPRFPLSRE